MNDKLSARTNPPVCLSIAGLDPSGGAGILADVRTFAAFGCFAAAAVTSITFQNTQGVFGAVSQSLDIVRGQLDPVFEDYDVAAVKTGMLPTAEVIREAADVLAARQMTLLVVDPVVRSTSGFDLIDDNALSALVEILFRQALLVTPNIAEAERISGIAIQGEEDIRSAAMIMRRFGAENILIKGGHLPEIAETKHDAGDRTARDYLFTGEEVTVLSAPFVETDATHGTGCTLSAAITACLALGYPLKESVVRAKKFVNRAIATAPLVGKGHSPINIDPEFTR